MITGIVNLIYYWILQIVKRRNGGYRTKDDRGESSLDALKTSVFNKERSIYNKYLLYKKKNYVLNKLYN